MARKDQNLVADIDALRARLETRLDEIVDEEEAALRRGGDGSPSGIPRGVQRRILLRGEGNFFANMRRLLSERG